MCIVFLLPRWSLCFFLSFLNTLKFLDSTTSPKKPPKHLRWDPALSKLILSRYPTSKAKWAHNLLRNEIRKQRDQHRKVEYNPRGLHTMERVSSSSSYAFIYMVRLGAALTTPMGQCHCNLTLCSIEKHSLYCKHPHVLSTTFLHWSLWLLLSFSNIVRVLCNAIYSSGHSNEGFIEI